MKRILVCASDAGGANALVPVLERLEAGLGRPPAVAGEGAGRRVFRWAGRRVLRGEADALLDRVRPDVVLTGTSWGDTLDKRLVGAARGRGVFTVSVVDMWSYYRERFSTPGSAALDRLPSLIAVMDARARREAVAAGIPADRLVVTGQPHLEAVARRGRSPAVARAARRWRQRWARRGRRLVLFASEAVARDFSPGGPRDRGYTEKRVLRELLSACGEAFDVVVKMHPQNTLRDVFQKGPVAFVKNVPPDVCVEAVDVVVGMTSMLLLEAALMGKPTISFQPGLTGKDFFVGNRVGLTRAVGDSRALGKILGSIRPSTRAKTKPFRNTGAARRLARLVIRGGKD